MKCSKCGRKTNLNMYPIEPLGTKWCCDECGLTYEELKRGQVITSSVADIFYSVNRGIKKKYNTVNWISVNEKLPEIGKRVIATAGCFVGEMNLNKNGVWCRNNYSIEDCLNENVSHWYYLPQPPKEVK